MATPATPDDVLASARRAFEGMGLAGAVTLPLGTWHAERPEGKTPLPYTVAECVEGSAEHYTGGFLRTFKLSATWRGTSGTSDAAAASAGLQTLDWYRGLTLPGTDAKVVHVRPADGGVQQAKAQYRGRDVVELTAAWDVLVSQPEQVRAAAISSGVLAGIGADGVAIGATGL